MIQRTGESAGEGKDEAAMRNTPHGGSWCHGTSPKIGVKDPLSQVTLGKSRNLQISVFSSVKWNNK